MNKIILKFIIPIIIGLSIGYISAFYNQDIGVRLLNTISENILVIITFITPLLTLVIVTSGINQIRENKIKFLTKFFGVILLSSFILGVVVLLFSLVVVPIFSFDLIRGSEIQYIDPYFKLGLISPFGIFFAAILGIILGLLINPKGYIGKIFEDIQKLLYKFLEKIIMPIMPLWIIGTFAATGYQSAGLEFLLTDFILSWIIIIIQFLWLGIAYFVVSKTKKINFSSIRKSGLKIYGFVLSIAGLGTSAVLPVIIEEQKKLGIDENKAKVVTATSFNMPGSLISNIVFAVGIVSMYNLNVSIEQYFTFLIIIVFALVAAPAVPGGVFAITSTILAPTLGFTPEMITMFGTMYYKQGTTNSATNNAADLYVTPFV